MEKWTCPKCSRTFGGRGRSHICKPGTTLDELAARSIPTFRPIVDRITAHLDSLPDADDELIVDPLDKLIQYKRRSVFAMVRPMTKWSAVSFNLPHRLVSPRLSRKVNDQRGTFHHTINVDDPDDVDEELLEWLAEAYEVNGVGRGPAPAAGDPMVPDDVDLW